MSSQCNFSHLKMKDQEWYLIVLEGMDTLILLPKVHTHIILILPQEKDKQDEPHKHV